MYSLLGDSSLAFLQKWRNDPPVCLRNARIAGFLRQYRHEPDCCRKRYFATNTRKYW
jgi:hypothetical protein